MIKNNSVVCVHWRSKCHFVKPLKKNVRKNTWDKSWDLMKCDLKKKKNISWTWKVWAIYYSFFLHHRPLRQETSFSINQRQVCIMHNTSYRLTTGGVMSIWNIIWCQCFFFLFFFSLWWCCFCLTLAFSTVQCKELVALSYKRSNSKVPREARKQFRKKSRQMQFFFFVCNTVITKAKPSGKVNVTLPHTNAGARTFRRAAVEQAT